MDAYRTLRPNYRSVTMNCFAPHKQRHWPGTSKWNKIEHRLFSHISMNWRGRPLTSHQVIVETIAATTTRTGLTVHAELDTGLYPAGIQVSDEQMAALPLTRHPFHGDWNYTLGPRLATPASQPAAATGPAPPSPGRARCDPAALSHPALTGLPPCELHDLVTALAIPWAAGHEQALFLRRGGHRRRKRRSSGGPWLSLTDHILATLIHQHLRLPCRVIAPLFGVDHNTLGYAIRATRELLAQHTTTTQPAPARPRTLDDLFRYAAAAGITLPPEIKPAC